MCWLAVNAHDKTNKNIDIDPLYNMPRIDPSQTPYVRKAANLLRKNMPSLEEQQPARAAAGLGAFTKRSRLSLTVAEGGSAGSERQC